MSAAARRLRALPSPLHALPSPPGFERGENLFVLAPPYDEGESSPPDVHPSRGENLFVLAPPYDEGEPSPPDVAPSLRNKGKVQKDGHSQSGLLITQALGNKSQAHMQVDFQRQMHGAGEYTIQFYVNPPVDVANPFMSGVYFAVAEITWSVEGNFVRRLVSIVNGMSISGVGQAVKVNVYDTTPSIGGANTPGLPYRVGMQVSRGSRPSQNQPPIYLDTLAQTLTVGPSSFLWTVPQNAGVISAKVLAFETSSDLDAFVNVQQYAGVPGHMALLMASYDPSTDSGFQPILPGVTTLQVTNEDTSHTADVTVVWGIDG